LARNIYKDILTTSKKILLSICASVPTTIIPASSLIDLKNILFSSNLFPNINAAYKVTGGWQNLGKTIEYTIGKYYIQSLSSMLPALVLNPNENDKVLDLCAAPGSKTTQISEMMNFSGTLYANESALSRTRALVYNLDKMKAMNMGVLNLRGEKLSKVFNNYFDKILVDAPCSALGIIQKKNEVSNWWSVDHANKLSDMQLKLLISAIKMLKVGGEIVYSTCTMSIEENELVLNTILKKYPVEIEEIELPVNLIDGFTKYGDETLDPQIKKAKRVIPWEIDSEGFFVAKLRKVAETESNEKLIFKDKQRKLLFANHKEIRPKLIQIEERFGVPFKELANYNYMIKKNDIFFINRNWQSENLNPFIRVGTKFGIFDRRGYIHLHSNAARVLADHVSENVVALESENELKKYFTGATIKKPRESFGQKIIKWQNDILGTASASPDGLKSQFPRSMRTHEIFFP
jgi:16S rRNA (cytosine1407-C5)-methyltransferase